MSAPEDRLAVVHERLAAAVSELTTGDDWLRAMAFAANFRSRSFSNSLLIWVQHAEAYASGAVSAPSPTFVAGYKQWLALGRQVEKGQSGYAILAPVTARFALPPGSDEWRRLDRGEKPLPGERVESKLIGTRRATVFDVSQTTGEPLPDRDQPVLLSGQAPAGLKFALEDRLRSAGFAVDYVAAAELGGANGVTDFAQQRVAVRIDLSPAAEVKTLAHELGHALLHDPAARGDGDVRLHRGIGEVEAESFAAMIGAAHGLDTSAYTVPYVAGWASTVTDREPYDVVLATGGRVLAAAKAVLADLDTAQVTAGDPPGLDQVREQTAARRGRPRATTPRPVSSTAQGPAQPAGVGL